MAVNEESQISILVSPSNGVAREEKPEDVDDDKEDLDNTPDWLSDAMSATDNSLINSTTHDYR